MNVSNNVYTVIRDTREKDGQGWNFRQSERCAGTIIKKLDVGDYSLLGFEKLVTIERKGAVAEFCMNLTQQRFVGKYDDSKPFSRQSEIIRLQSIEWPYVLLEFDVEDLLKYPNIPELPPHLRKSIIFKGPAALKKIIELEMQYKTRFIFCGKLKAKDVASSIFKRVTDEIQLREYKKNNP